MSKRKPMDKEQARERRNHLLQSAATAELSLTEAVREMRAVSGMTQEEFARHRGVSARVIKAIELGQGNPTVATLNRIGQFFGLEVAFVPVKRKPAAARRPLPAAASTESAAGDADLPRGDEHRIAAIGSPEFLQELAETRENMLRHFSEALDALDSAARTLHRHGPAQKNSPGDPGAAATPARKKSKPRTS